MTSLGEGSKLVADFIRSMVAEASLRCVLPEPYEDCPGTWMSLTRSQNSELSTRCKQCLFEGLQRTAPSSQVTRALRIAGAEAYGRLQEQEPVTTAHTYVGSFF